MPLFSSRRRRADATTASARGTGFRNLLRRRDPDRVAGGFKSALSNPNTTRDGRRHAKRELRRMVSFDPTACLGMANADATRLVTFVGSGRRDPRSSYDQDQAVPWDQEHAQAQDSRTLHHGHDDSSSSEWMVQSSSLSPGAPPAGVRAHPILPFPIELSKHALNTAGGGFSPLLIPPLPTFCFLTTSYHTCHFEFFLSYLIALPIPLTSPGCIRSVDCSCMYQLAILTPSRISRGVNLFFLFEPSLDRVPKILSNRRATLHITSSLTCFKIGTQSQK